MIYDGDMTRWTYGVLMVALAGACGDSKEETCTAKRKAAADAVVSALPSLEIERDTRTRHIVDGETALAELGYGEKELAERIKLFEQSMDCLHYKTDCCQRIRKIKDLRNIWPTMNRVFQEPLPQEVVAVLAPMKSLEVDAEDLFGGTPAFAEKFCTASRTQIERIRSEVPAAWTAARTVLQNDLEKRKALHDLAQRRVKAIGEWADAIRKSQKATIDADLSEGAHFTYRDARSAVEVYNAACF